MPFDEEPLRLFVPVLASARIAPARPHHRIPALELESEHLDIELARAHRAGDIVRRIGHAIDAAVPNDYLAGTVVALGNDALEIAVLDRMVLDHHGKPLVGGIERRPLGHGPRAQHAFHLETEVVMEPGGRVLLHDEHTTGPTAQSWRFAEWLRRAVGAALAPIFFERHRFFAPSSPLRFLPGSLWPTLRPCR